MFAHILEGLHRLGEHPAGAAARSISVRIAGAMIAITGFGAMLLVLGVTLGSRHEFSERGIDPNNANAAADSQGALVIDSRHAVVFIILFVVGIIIATAVVGWFFSRREIRPMQEAMRLQRHFVADASHELKTPLAVISARIELLERHLHAGKPVDSELSGLHDDVTRMNDVINDLLMAMRSSLHPVPVHLASAVQRAVSTMNLLAVNKGVRITTAFGDEPLFVMGGQTGLERCLVAVLDNAIAHCGKGSMIEVEIRSAREHVVGGNGNGWVTILVRDSGTGISGDPERLFGRFSQGAHGSEGGRYGLGLALVRDILTRYDGTIAITSEGAGGTLVSITLPRAGAQAGRSGE